MSSGDRMPTKFCYRCQNFLTLGLFGTDNSTKDKLSCWCFSCAKELAKQRYTTDSQAFKATSKRYRDTHKENIAKAAHQYRKKHKEQLAQYDLKYRKHNREKLNSQDRARSKERMRKDPVFKLSRLLRSRLNEVLKQKSLHKKSRMSEYLGCTLEELKIHIEKQFKPGMTWENHALKGWHVDHILPLLPETPISEEEMYRRCHYTNLQPLWATDNIKKGNYE